MLVLSSFLSSPGPQALQDGAATFRVALLASVETYWKQAQGAAASVSSGDPIESNQRRQKDQVLAWAY